MFRTKMITMNPKKPIFSIKIRQICNKGLINEINKSAKMTFLKYEKQ